MDQEKVRAAFIGMEKVYHKTDWEAMRDVLKVHEWVKFVMKVEWKHFVDGVIDKNLGMHSEYERDVYCNHGN